jgi:hypothetical protein
MEQNPQMSREKFVEAMRAKFEKMLGQVADAVNEAAPGFIITDSEEKVRDLFATLRREAYETAVQMRMDEAEAVLPRPQDPVSGKKNDTKGDKTTAC